MDSKQFLQMHTEYDHENKRKFTIPIWNTDFEPITFDGQIIPNYEKPNSDSPIYYDLNTVWNTQKFKTPREPLVMDSTFFINKNNHTWTPNNIRITDLPIKFPGTNYRLPAELQQLESVIKRVADIERTINGREDEYYCYLTVDQGSVKKGTLQRETSCHVDGFQGARQLKTLINHSYTICDNNPTVYYPQLFDFDELDDKIHDYFWEMNRQVAMTNSEFAMQHDPFDIVLMDAYCVHRGSIFPEDMYRTFIRITYEVRIFDRKGNAHNPFFDYYWPMQIRDIKSLNLIPFDNTCDPSLRQIHHMRYGIQEKDMPILRI